MARGRRHPEIGTRGLLMRINPDIMRQCVHDVLNSAESIASPAISLAHWDHPGDASVLLHWLGRSAACAGRCYSNSDVVPDYATEGHHARPVGLRHLHGHFHGDSQRYSVALHPTITHVDLHASSFRNTDIDPNLHPAPHRHSKSVAYRHTKAIADRHANPDRAFSHIRGDSMRRRRAR